MSRWASKREASGVALAHSVAFSFHLSDCFAHFSLLLMYCSAACFIAPHHGALSSPNIFVNGLLNSVFSAIMTVSLRVAALFAADKFMLAEIANFCKRSSQEFCHTDDKKWRLRDS